MLRPLNASLSDGASGQGAPTGSESESTQTRSQHRPGAAAAAAGGSSSGAESAWGSAAATYAPEASGIIIARLEEGPAVVTVLVPVTVR